jgi:hypothetical protein
MANVMKLLQEALLFLSLLIFWHHSYALLGSSYAWRRSVGM